MKIFTNLAIILIAAGIVAFGYQGIADTTREKVVDLGSLQMTAEETGMFPSPPMVGGIVFLCYIGLLTMGRNKS